MIGPALHMICNISYINFVPTLTRYQVENHRWMPAPTISATWHVPASNCIVFIAFVNNEHIVVSPQVKLHSTTKSKSHHKPGQSQQIKTLQSKLGPIVLISTPEKKVVQLSLCFKTGRILKSQKIAGTWVRNLPIFLHCNFTIDCWGKHCAVTVSMMRIYFERQFPRGSRSQFAKTMI